MCSSSSSSTRSIGGAVLDASGCRTLIAWDRCLHGGHMSHCTIALHTSYIGYVSHSMVHNAHVTLHNVLVSLNCGHFVFHIAESGMHIAHCTLHIVHCTCKIQATQMSYTCSDYACTLVTPCCVYVHVCSQIRCHTLPHRMYTVEMSYASTQCVHNSGDVRHVFQQLTCHMLPHTVNIFQSA